MKLFKRVMAVLLVISLLPAMPFVALAEEEVVTTGTSEGLIYEITNGEVTITGYTSDVSEYLLIPETIEGYPVTTIGDDTFNGSRLYYVSIPKSVTKIGRAFYECFELEAIEVNEDNANYSTGYQGVLFDKDKTVLVQAPNAIYGSYIIPDSVTVIEDYAFYYCDDLTAVEIPNSVTTIGQRSFAGCCKLTSLEIPNSVTTIEDEAFYGCYGLTSMDIPNSVTTIGAGAFYSCGALSSVDIPNSVITIGAQAFYLCESLTSIDIPEGVTSIGEKAFACCPSLSSVGISSSVTTIGPRAFYECAKLRFIWVHDDNENYSNDERGVLFNKDKTVLVQAPGSISGSYSIPESVVTVGQYAFSVCDYLTSLTMHKGLKNIEAYAFAWCMRLTSVAIPEGVTTIGERAFYICTGLTSVDIPDSITSIGKRSFYGCDSLTDVYYGGTLSQWNQITIEGANEALTNATLHAETAALNGIAVKTQPTKTEYWIGEELEISGLTLTAVYEDNSTQTVTEGFTVTGFDPNTTGVQNLTVTYGEVTDTYEVVVHKAIIRDTLQEAIRDCVEEFDRILLEGNVEENVELSKDVELDLNGFSITGKITGSGKLILVDSNTDDFTVMDGEGYGKVSLEMGAHIVPGKGYVKITEADGVSVHRVRLDVKSMSLRPEKAGLYFNSDFAGDEVVAEHVSGFGVALSVTGAPDEKTLENSKHFTRFGKEFFGMENTSTLLTGVLKPTNGYNTNLRNARLKVYGRAYMEVDGVIVFGDCQSRSLQEQIEGMDGIWDRLSASQKNGALSLYNQYQKIFRGWNIPNIKNAAK